jgi:putative transposase
MDIFHSDHDRDQYLQFIKEESQRFETDILAWCLMTNHVHFIVRNILRQIGALIFLRKE